jgi:hypothetical protein
VPDEHIFCSSRLAIRPQQLPCIDRFSPAFAAAPLRKNRPTWSASGFGFGRRTIVRTDSASMTTSS